MPRSELCSTTGVSKEAKPAKIVSLIEKIFWGARLKECRKNFSVLLVAVAKRGGFLQGLRIAVVIRCDAC